MLENSIFDLEPNDQREMIAHGWVTFNTTNQSYYVFERVLNGAVNSSFINGEPDSEDVIAVKAAVKIKVFDFDYTIEAVGDVLLSGWSVSVVSRGAIDLLVAKTESSEITMPVIKKKPSMKERAMRVVQRFIRH